VIKVLAFPAFKNKDSNPYNYLLYSGINKYNVLVKEFSFSKCIMLDYDLIHIHWPELYLSSNYLMKAIVYSFLLLFSLSFAKLFGKKIVWTVHNIKPHKIKYKILNKIYWLLFTPMVDAIISLSKANEIIANKLSFKETIKKKVIYHGLYNSIYENSISKYESKKIFSIPGDKKVCLFIGQIKPYKNIELLIELFNIEPILKNYFLIIAGRFESTKYYDEVISHVKSKNIIIHNKFIPNIELQNYFNASNVCILPFNDIFNSGSALLPASFNTSVIIPFSENFYEYQALLGKDKMFIYNNKLTAEIISAHLCEEKNIPKPISTVLSWPQIQNNLSEFYKEILA